jgi:uncharacterized Tic20 family protein
MNQESQNNNALIIHLSALSSFIIPFGSLLLPIILWQALKKDNPYVDHHGKEAVNFNLSFFLYFVVLIGLFIASILGTITNAIKMDEMENSDKISELLFTSGGLIITIIVLSVIGIVKLILIIIATIKAGQGELYRYPLIIRFIK